MDWGNCKAFSRAAITLVRDRKKELPQKDIKRIAIIALTRYEDEVESLRFMVSEFEKRDTMVFFYRDTMKDDKWEPDLDLILYVTFCRQHKPVGPLVICRSWQTASYQRHKVVAVALGSPYILNMNFPTANMVIATYSGTVGCQQAVMGALFGEISFSGTLSVELPSI